ncbi:MAG: metallopeptidase family protein [Acidobacteriota bacterium]
MRVSEDEFAALVERAMEQLPPEFVELLENISVVVEDEPEAELLAEMNMDPEDELLGLYRGVPLIERETGYADLPDQVVLYRLPLVRIARDRRELIREVRDTLVHELGHYFGLTDEEMPY